MATDAQAALSAALDRMWIQFLPQMNERVGILETAAQAFAAGPLPVDRQDEAQAAAHKLAGVLGTFGLTRGTVLARELESKFARESSPGRKVGAKLAEIATELRSMVEGRKPSA